MSISCSGELSKSIAKQSLSDWFARPNFAHYTWNWLKNGGIKRGSGTCKIYS